MPLFITAQSLIKLLEDRKLMEERCMREKIFQIQFDHAATSAGRLFISSWSLKSTLSDFVSVSITVSLLSASFELDRRCRSSMDEEGSGEGTGLDCFSNFNCTSSSASSTLTWWISSWCSRKLVSSSNSSSHTMQACSYRLL